MKPIFLLGFLALTAYAAPITEEGIVEVTQDTAGYYKITVRTPSYTKVEERLVDGTVKGEYSYPDANGEVKTFKYISDNEGYRVLEGEVPQEVALGAFAFPSGDLPKPVEETEEVKAAREAHLAAHAGILQSLA